jgi:peptidoglycan/xylan/chitin deacetylase (PgdA/CDA1 family)
MFRYVVSLLKDKNWNTADLFKIKNTQQLNEVVKNKKSEVEAIVHSFLTDYRPYMITAQIQSLSSQGFSIGAHSCSHPYYADLSIEEQLTETYQSLAILRDNFGISQRLFAFPFTDTGVSTSFFEAIFKSNQVDFSFGGAGIKGDIQPHQWQRIPMEAGSATAEQILKSEYLYYLMRIPFNRNKIVRQ